ncbi:hypothetical protein Cgig2_001637 [Carnegiea gigantea]|uniref:Uncharacterized protein n=1 Tax=Carnegiea gigantea TaxID=171969 RepID=A0A9Q1GVR1_9CARY|nr:hypothetical protein Cgig2_001637 [Carnegiea gigantea]
MATCSSPTLDGSAELVGASDHSLASFSTKVHLAEASAAKKSAGEVQLYTEGSPAASGEDRWSPRDPSPHPQGGGRRHEVASCPPSACGRLQESKWGRFKDPAIGFLSRGASGRACRKEKSVSTFHSGRATRKDKRRVSEVKPSWLAFPLACAALPYELSRPQQRSARPKHPRSQGATTSLALVRTNRKAYIQEKRQVPLEKFLRIKRPRAARKNLLPKNFNLGSQFIGSASHERWNRPGTVMLSYIEVEIVGYPFFNLDRLPKRIPDRLSVVPIENISPTRFTTHEKEVIFSVFNLGLLFNGHHETLLIVETIPPKVLDLTRSLLY